MDPGPDQIQAKKHADPQDPHPDPDPQQWQEHCFGT
jgi:hypothetical protein